MLKFGPDSNFAKFKEKVSRLALEKFGDLGRLIESEEYFEPAAPAQVDYDFENDDHGINLHTFKEALKEHNNAKRIMRSYSQTLQWIL